MRLVKIVVLLIVVAGLINFVRDGRGFHIAQVFPFLGGYEPGIVDVAAVAMVVMTFHVLRRANNDDNG